MEVHVGDFGHGVDALHQLHVGLAAIEALRTGRNHVVGVERANQPRRPGNPLGEGLLVLLAEGARLVANLPREDGRVVGIPEPRIAVRAADDEAHVLLEQRASLAAGDEVRDILDVGLIAVDGRDGRLAGTCPGQVLRIAARPLPRIGQVEHGLHAAPSQLGEEVVQTVEQLVVVLAGDVLERRFDFGGDSPAAVGPHQHAQVRHAAGGQRIELPRQAFAVAAGALRAEDGAVPEVGTQEVAGFAVEHEAAVLDADERITVLRGAAAAGQPREHAEAEFEERFHGIGI